MSLSPTELAEIAAQVTAAMKTAMPAPPAPAVTFADQGLRPAASFAVPAPAPAAMWPAGAMPTATPTPTGVSVRISMPLPDGSEMSFDVSFGPEYANPAGLQALAAQLLAAGWPVKTFRPRESGGFGGQRFGNNDRWGNRGGWNGRRY